MKRLLLFIGMSILLVGCKQESVVIPVLDDLIAEYREDDAIRLEVSDHQIVLDPTKRREQALLVTWEPLKEVEAHYPVKYLFKMDVTANDFTTSIPTIEMPEGIYFKTYTHEDLEKLLRNHWQRVESDAVSISIRVIAQVASGEKFVKPLYSTLSILVTPYQIESSSLFIYGTATVGANMVEMQEVVPGEIYSWRGKFNPGSFKIAEVMDQPYPAYGKGEGDEIVLMESEGQPGEDFIVNEEGVYAIILDRINQKIAIQEVPYLNIYFGGSATPTAWSTPPVMVWDVFKPNICTITTQLVGKNPDGSGGELKFSTQPNFSSGTLQLRPWRPEASILSDLHVQASSAPDWKWRVQPGEAGRYTIVLDVRSMKVQFIKID
ncbi:SusF/SusE family outer membrane protein [Parapusillimonas sp. SGNA-6]|uniref:SusE domain-containing protein n=1 Tax=Parapedobacter sp. SGR-10 TaxID=2710879 RepID=UPI0013D2B162|nr:SusF/SusE family outer membrane protein [Parapedobacter sp. SGR-10]NGF55173.1 SusF/SusE family outer membrane protein [Parapedobacter sp. SGR-10]NGM89347.1 SusF/SusE family outer membrane protein [Parapusillimonas sp. SGNA-6]